MQSINDRKLQILLEDLSYRFSKDDIPKIRKAIEALKKATEIPVSPLNPSSGYHPIVIFRKRFGRYEKEAPVSLLDLNILTKYNLPAWRRAIVFHVDDDTVEYSKIMNIETILIGNPRRLSRLKNILLRILEYTFQKPRRLILLYDDIYMDFGNNRYIYMQIRGGDMRIQTINMNLSIASKLLGRSILHIDSSFGNKNREFYRLLFVYSLETRGSFETFFMRYIFPRLNPEQREFLEEMHDYRNFITLLYSELSRINKDRISDEVGIRINRRANPKRPLEIGIVFTDHGIEVRRYIHTLTVSLLV
ncbi:hypothetical protein E3E31_11480 [Thermococcus sp. M39]|uniref:hypothetical protein n=1 Tax=unclassified Thermococcus TaxID=2627626 RepID=UPI00143C68A0|nr:MULTISPECIES: hypothetical protein [unclassified Thermococcus]NJE09134.1 hypothetical protein [Thermococcus sp. M39]NJE12083.1 hypothetical protein [Thermococcus sp. LS2]